MRQGGIGECLRQAARRLAVLPQAEPWLEAQLLLAEATGLSRAQLLTWPERRLEETAGGARFASLLARRLGGEPIAHIRARQAFWTLELQITPDTLIPRPETELLVETALERLPAGASLKIADAGTGSGAIAAALAVERPAWQLIAVERSATAAAVAVRNLARYAPTNARVLRADWLASLAPDSLDAIVSNPPYLAEDDPHLRQGDLPREPVSALVAGADGLDAIRGLLRQAILCLRPGGLLALEHGHDQGEAVRALFACHDLTGILTRLDLAGHPRVTLGVRRG